MFAFLLKGGFVDVQSGTDFSAQQFLSVLGQSVHDRPVSPRRVRQKLLQHLIVAIRNRFGHPLHVSLLGLHQAAQILLCRFDHAVVTRAKQFSVSVAEAPVRIAQVLERFLMANPVFASTFLVNFNMILFVTKHGLQTQPDITILGLLAPFLEKRRRRRPGRERHELRLRGGDQQMVDLPDIADTGDLRLAGHRREERPREIRPGGIRSRIRNERLREFVNVVGVPELGEQVPLRGPGIEGVQDHIAARRIVEAREIPAVRVGDDGPVTGSQRAGEQLPDRGALAGAGGAEEFEAFISSSNGTATPATVSGMACGPALARSFRVSRWAAWPSNSIARGRAIAANGLPSRAQKSPPRKPPAM